MTNRTIKFFPDIGHSPAWCFVPGAMTELVANGFSESAHEAPNYQDPVLVLFENDTLLGFIAYRYDPRRSGWWIMLSYTVPEYRGQRVNGELFAALVERAQLKGDILAIQSGVSVDNEPMRKAALNQGRAAVGVIYEYPIRCAIEGKAHTDVN